ncbi:MAG: aspartate aminotransferase family protein [Phycisphaerales bacterium]|nr:aspartate aminotransferase family protein [Phycisphaerales bacterium]
MPSSLHMSSDEFRQHGYAVIDWIADYLRDVERHPVLSPVRPGEIRDALPKSPPREGEPFEQMLQDVDDLILPGITHWQSPRFFGFFPANTSGPSILGDLLASGLGVQGMLWATSPACTEVETLVLDWLVEMLGLPERFRSTSSGGGVLQDTASSASLCALLAARERATEFASNERGSGVAPLVAYTSNQAHSSIEKAMKIAGLGRENLRLIDVDEHFAMRPDALDDAIRADLDAGRVPCFVCATVGTTSSNGMDPVRAIGAVCAAHGIWLHVDAAMSGTAALCEEFRVLQDGLELADSYCFNPHKWMFTNFDCDCFYVADRATLIRTLSILPEYLKNAATESGAVFDYRDWHVPLGRRFRALKLWFVIRHYGHAGLQALVREHVALAQAFASWVRADERFELVVPPPLNLVCVRLRAGDEATTDLVERLNATGRIYLTPTRLGGRAVIRVSIGGTQTERRHVEEAWRLMRAMADAVLV